MATKEAVKETVKNTNVNAERYEVDGVKFVKFELMCIKSKSHAGNPYMAFRIYDKDGKRREVRFTKEVTAVPDKNCYIHINLEKINVDNSRRKTILWIKAIEQVEAKLVGYEPYDWDTIDKQRNTATYF